MRPSASRAGRDVTCGLCSGSIGLLRRGSAGGGLDAVVGVIGEGARPTERRAVFRGRKTRLRYVSCLVHSAV